MKQLIKYQRNIQIKVTEKVRRAKNILKINSVNSKLAGNNL